MSVIPEVIIQRVLVDGIRELRHNPWKSEQLFKSIPQKYAQQFNELITKTSIDVTINYPREDSQFPCIAILLRSEDESTVVIGDLLGGGADYESGLVGSEEFFFESTTTSTADPLYDNPLIGEPSRLFDKDTVVYKERMGSGFTSSYLLQIMTDDQDFTVLMYHAARFVILSSLRTFELNGIYQMKLGGTDFLPQPAQQPTFIFIRGLSLSFLYFADRFDIYDNQDPSLEKVAKAFVIDMEDREGERSGMITLAQSPHAVSLHLGMLRGTEVVFQQVRGNITVSRGSSITVILNGFNIQKDLSIEVFDPNIIDPVNEYTTSVPLYVVSDIKILSNSVDTVFHTSFAGQADSTNLEYHATENIPSSLSEGMFLEVIGPSTHAAYKEHRRILSVVPGIGGKITVVNAFSDTLVGTFVSVFKRSSNVEFTLDVSSSATTGLKSIKITNTDSLESTLNNAIEVT